MSRRIAVLIALCTLLICSVHCLQLFEYSAIAHRTTDTCFVVGIHQEDLKHLEHVGAGDGMSSAGAKNDRLKVREILTQVQDVFQEEDVVEVGWILKKDLEQMTRHSAAKQQSHIQYDSLNDFIAVIPKTKIDRTCLLASPSTPIPKLEVLKGPFHLELVTDFVNNFCDVFRSVQGRQLVEGLHRQHILENVFHVSSISDVSMDMLYKSPINPLNNSFCWNCLKNSRSSPDESSHSVNCENKGFEVDSCTDDSCSEPKLKTNHWHSPNIPRCERIPTPNSKDFFHKYLKKSRPVVIQGGISHWSAMQKWSLEFFKKEYGDRDIHIKLAPGGNFEGVEYANIWEDFEKMKMPHHVKQQLSFPELVVVRPAYLNVKLSEFIDLVQNRSYLNDDVSAYLEYSSIPDHLPELEGDIEELSFVKGMLKRKHLNMWLSNGNTVGKLHFDPFDNLLCQLSGTKQVILFEPFNNTQFYEAHIPEAMLGFDKSNRTFRRKTLKDSTSMVMSPVDITKPDFEKFPRFKDAMPLNCTIGEGDVLFMPAFWWHEVVSYPSKDARNLAVNYWYEPFLTKDFPCPECNMDVNIKEYRHLL